MTWLPADYAVLIAAAVAGVVGILIGFSGSLSFLIASAGGSFAGWLLWGFVAGYVEANWVRLLVVLIGAILAFGLVRFIVKKFVKGMLQQPADSIFGFFTAAITGFGLALVVIYLVNHFNIARLPSTLLGEAVNFV